MCPLGTKCSRKVMRLPAVRQSRSKKAAVPLYKTRHRASLDVAFASREAAKELKRKATRHDDECATNARVNTNHDLSEVDCGCGNQRMIESLA